MKRWQQWNWYKNKSLKINTTSYISQCSDRRTYTCSPGALYYTTKLCNAAELQWCYVSRYALFTNRHVNDMFWAMLKLSLWTQHHPKHSPLLTRTIQLLLKTCGLRASTLRTEARLPTPAKLYRITAQEHL